MKKIYLLLTFVLFTSSIFFTSCNKDKDDDNSTTHENFTPEQHKEAISTASNDAITQLETLKDSKAFDGAETLVNLFETNFPFEESGTKKIQSILKGINKFIENPTEKEEFLKDIKCKDIKLFVYDDFVGEYSWNSGTQSWDKTSSTKIIFNFPATEGGTTNNATLTFEYYTDSPFLIDGDNYYLPTGISINLYVDGTKELEFIFAATYKEDGIPETLDITLFVNPFTLTAEIRNTDTTISDDFAWTLDDKNILSLGSALNGDFSSIDLGEEFDPGDYITDASSYVQVFDVRLEGTVNVAAFITLNDELTLEFLNSNTTILLKWASDDVKIADGEFYEKTTEELSVMLKFTDGTEIDAEVFFENVINEFVEFFENLEA